MQKISYNYRVSTDAKLDIYESYLWYEKQQTGLGEEFLKSLDTAEQSIIKNPKMFRVRYKKRIRGYVVGRFPYLVLYIIEGNEINVISVFNTHQHPSIWKERV